MDARARRFRRLLNEAVLALADTRLVGEISVS